jgi:hypothetical protein
MPETYTTQIHSLRVGDTGRPLEAILELEDGTVRDLTGCTVELWLTNRATGEVKTAAAEVVGAATAGRVKYAFDAEDVAVAASFSAVWVVADSAGKLISYPSEGSILIPVSAR